MLLLAINVMMGLGILLLAVSLGYGLVLSRRIRKAAVIHLPEPWRSHLSSIFFALWLVVILLAIVSVVRLVYAGFGFNTTLGVALTGMATAVSLIASYHVSKACLHLRKVQ